MRITPTKLGFLIVASVLCGCAFFIQWLHVFGVRNAPIVAGTVIGRQPIDRLGFVPSVDFTIRVEGSNSEVHARTARYLLHSVPENVRFRYSGDPAREIFLFELEEDPSWIFVFFWGMSIVLAFILVHYRRSQRFRRALNVGYLPDSDDIA